MKRTRKNVNTGEYAPFVKKDEEIKEGNVVTIVDEGRTQEGGQYGEQFVVTITLPNGEDRSLTLNQTSENNLIDEFGDDSIHWINKKARVFKEKKVINGKRVTIVYLAPTNWERDDYGYFIRLDDPQTTPKRGVPRPSYPTSTRASVSPDEEPIPYPEYE